MQYVFQKAFHLMRSGRPGPVHIDLPIDVQIAEIEFDPDTYQPMDVFKSKASRAQFFRQRSNSDSCTSDAASAASCWEGPSWASVRARLLSWPAVANGGDGGCGGCEICLFIEIFKPPD